MPCINTQSMNNMIHFDFESLKYPPYIYKGCFSAVRKDATKREISFHASHFTFDIIQPLLINKKIWISDEIHKK